MISIKNLLAVTALMTGGAFISCGNSQKNSQQIEESEAAIVQAPAFNADSAYAYIAAQVQFGPRVPNTEAHRRCGDYLAAQLEKFGAKVYNQHADLVAYNGTHPEIAQHHRGLPAGKQKASDAVCALG